MNKPTYTKEELLHIISNCTYFVDMKPVCELFYDDKELVCYFLVDAQEISAAIHQRMKDIAFCNSIERFIFVDILGCVPIKRDQEPI